jgi:hypothetical protein
MLGTAGQLWLRGGIFWGSGWMSRSLAPPSVADRQKGHVQAIIDFFFG